MLDGLFVTADQRLARPRKVNMIVFGPSGVGKTTLARTLDPKTTLFINAEAGDLALGDWPGAILNIREIAQKLGVHPWEMARALACIMSGPDPAETDPGKPYSRASYESYCASIGGPEAFAQFTTVFWDSITVAGRWSFAWAQTQPEAFSEKTGKPDNRGAYGKHGQEMIKWMTVIQHTPDKSTIAVGILDKILDEFKRPSWEPQIEGSKAGRELPGIFDQVLTLMNFTAENGVGYRALVTKQDNQFGFPAKDRSGCLDALEPPDLGALMAKIRAGKRQDATLALGLPAPAAA